MFVPALLLRHRFLMGFQHKFWRTHLEILFLGFRGLYSVFDLLKVSFLFRQAVSFVSSLSFLGEASCHVGCSWTIFTLKRV